MKTLKINIPISFLIQRHGFLCLLVVIFTLFSTILEMVSLGTIVPLFNIILNKDSLSNSYGDLIDRLSEMLHRMPQENLLVSLFIFLIVVTIIKVSFRMGCEVVKRILDLRIQVDSQKLMYQKIIRSDLSFFISQKTGGLIFRILQLPREVSTYFQKMPVLFIETVNIVFLSILLLSLSPLLFCAVAAFGILYSFMIHYLSRDFLEKLGEEFPKATAAPNIVANEAIGGIREIIIHGNQEHWIKRFIEKCDLYYKLKIKTSILRIIPGNILEVFVVCGACLLGILYAKYDMDKFVAMIPVLGVYVAGLFRMMPSFSNIGNARMQLATYLPSAKLYERLLNEKNTQRKDGEEIFRGFQKEIRFERVHFAYDPGISVLEDFNVVLPKNKTIAVVGRSGTGKTTFIDLLLGLYPPDTGRILVDEQDISRLKIKSWRNKVGIVSQNSFIFNASVKENIAFDFKDIDMERVEAAARMAGAHEFISGLKEGYGTELGDRGYKLSGGQRQRIVIARALYADPDIVIFDEATSALDNQTERIIMDTITSLSNKKTIVILAHRLSTIKKADIIYVLKDKRVSQSGTHEELLRQAGEYSQLYQTESV